MNAFDFIRTRRDHVCSAHGGSTTHSGAKDPCVGVACDAVCCVLWHAQPGSLRRPSRRWGARGSGGTRPPYRTCACAVHAEPSGRLCRPWMVAMAASAARSFTCRLHRSCASRTPHRPATATASACPCSAASSAAGSAPAATAASSAFIGSRAAWPRPAARSCMNGHLFCSHLIMWLQVAPAHAWMGWWPRKPRCCYRFQASTTG